MNARVLVTGASGQLARAVVEDLGRDRDVVELPRAALDIADQKAVDRVVSATRPAVIVNCAAYSRVDDAEDDARAAFDANAFGVKALARAAAATGATLVHYSTDFVFNGNASRPYREDDPPDPRNVYAMSKLAGEWFARDALRSYVLRVESLFGGPTRTSSLDRIIAAIVEGREARVFADRTISPSYTRDVASATRRLLELDAAPGLYHCVNSGQVTWLALAQEAATLLGRDAALVPVTMDAVPMRAPRPKYCALSNQKLAAAGVPMPGWRDALARHLDQLFGPLS
jgi:dTDP-4-dehydrorhamnose reductase